MGELALDDSRGGETLLGASKPVALLVYLALGPNRRSGRDHVAELFWRSASLEDARHSLRQALYRLRVAADGAELIRSENGELALAAPIWLDCLAGEEALAENDVAAACDLLRGEFLGGFSIPESREFQTWSEAQHVRFSDGWMRAASELVRIRVAEGDPDGALGPAEQLATVRPFDEDTLRMLMSTLAAAGRHAAALARYEAFADLLRSEGEEEPSEPLRKYRDELQSFLQERRVQGERRLPFVGRSAEWARLEAAWEASRDGRGSTILVEGAAGLGKTRLLSELSDRVRASGGLVLTAKCYELGRTVPYAVMGEALAPSVDLAELESMGSAWISEAVRLLPELAERFPDAPQPPDRGSAVAAKRRLHQALARWIQVLATDSPILVSIDDLHWADAASLEVLHLLATRLVDWPTLLVISYRPLELRGAALRFARSLTNTHLADVIELAPLEPGEVGEILTGLGHFEAASVLRALSGHLHRQSGGNPLFLAELLEALAHARVLWVSGGTWRLGANARIDELPKTIQTLMSDRIDRLDPWMRGCAETLAVASGGASVELLARVLHLSEPRTELAIGVLCEQRLARATGLEEYDLIHDELRQLVYHSIPDERRRLLHFNLGAALESGGEARRPGGPARLAFHFDHAGDTDKAHRYAMLAVGEAETFAAGEERRAHLEVATAHSPVALPPGEPLGEGPEDLHDDRPPWIRRPATRAAAAIALPLAGALGLFALLDRPQGDRTDYRQGAVVFASPELGQTWPTHRLVWTDREDRPPSFERAPELAPRGPQRVFRKWVVEDEETHSSLFREVAGDTARLTRGRQDDVPQGWSPDGALLLVNRGFRAGDRFLVTLVLLDTLGKESTLVPPRPGNATAHWMPSGTRLLLRLDSTRVFDVGDSAGILHGSSVVLVDADGGHPRDLTREFGLPWGVPQLAVSPRGDKIAAVYPSLADEAGEIWFLDLELRTRRRDPWVHPPRYAGPAHWSPDGDWLLYCAVLGPGAKIGLWATRADGSEGPLLVAEIPASLQPVGWLGGPNLVARSLELVPAGLDLGVGEGLRMSGIVAGDTAPLPSVPVRWRTTDSAVARIDSLGFVRGRSAGSTRLIGSVGGRIADTISVSVTDRPTDTLLVEHWEAGLQPDRWTLFGRPLPQVRPGDFAAGSSLLYPSGDHNHMSGALSTRVFDVAPHGLTFAVDAWTRFSGGQWQDLMLGVETGPYVHDGEVTFERAGPRAEFTIQGPNQQVPDATLACNGEVVLASEHLAATPEDWTPARRRAVAIQIRPDGVTECWLDGDLVASYPSAGGSWSQPVHLLLAGRSEGTELAFGPVVVTRGLRH